MITFTTEVLTQKAAFDMAGKIQDLVAWVATTKACGVTSWMDVIHEGKIVDVAIIHVWYDLREGTTWYVTAKGILGEAYAVGKFPR